jgi:hypothetical protein
MQVPPPSSRVSIAGRAADLLASVARSIGSTVAAVDVGHDRERVSFVELELANHGQCRGLRVIERSPVHRSGAIDDVASASGGRLSAAFTCGAVIVTARLLSCAPGSIRLVGNRAEICTPSSGLVVV